MRYSGKTAPSTLPFLDEQTKYRGVKSQQGDQMCMSMQLGSSKSSEILSSRVLYRLYQVLVVFDEMMGGRFCAIFSSSFPPPLED